MLKKISLIFVWSLVLMFNTKVFAQEIEPQPVDSFQKEQIVDSISANYYEWETLSMSGKLNSPMLPVSASVKIYMEKGKLLVISISAILIGEAARIEIDEKEVLIVNKMKNSYTSLEMSMIEPICPGGLEALQNMLLGRVYLMGKGELSKRWCDDLELYYKQDNTLVLLPNQDLENAPYVYFYNIDEQNLLLDRLTVLPQSGNGEAIGDYQWMGKGLDLNLMAVMGNRGFEATLRLNNPDKTTKPLSRFNLTSKYRQTDLKGILK